jgi:hypothetical protein
MLLTITAVIITLVALIFCTTVGIKMIMEDNLGLGLLNIILGCLNGGLFILNLTNLLKVV